MNPSSSSPAELVAGNDDLLIEILSYLPVKPLLLFKSVNKQFLSLISDPHFSLLHSLRHSNLPSSALFLRCHNHHPSFCFFDFIPISLNPQTLTLTLTRPIDLLQSCNGLLLCANNGIHNPTTNQTVSLPVPSVRPILALNLAFDVSRSAHYNVICIWKLEQNCFAIDVLELNRENMEWFVKFRVDLDVLGRGFKAEMFQDHSDRFNRRFRFYAFSILSLVRGKEHEDGDDVLVVSAPGKVIAYSFESRVSRLVSNVGDDSDKWFPFKGYNAYQFIESLYCL